ncbi:MAG: OmpH family outer membrane protein [Flavobacteriales bacterium]|nr:OmpH family outer membrane protein [Flavobacteriales bacterium]
MKKVNTLSLLINVACLTIVLYIAFRDTPDKTAFFSSSIVYNEFDYKKELEKDLEQVQNKAISALDSLKLDLQMTAEYLNSIEPSQDQIIGYQIKEQNFYELQKKLDEEIFLKRQEYADLIWGRINEYVQEYGEENGYSYIYGATGNGALMYGAESENITEDILAHVNQRYAGE